FEHDARALRQRFAGRLVPAAVDVAQTLRHVCGGIKGGFGFLSGVSHRSAPKRGDAIAYSLPGCRSSTPIFSASDTVTDFQISPSGVLIFTRAFWHSYRSASVRSTVVSMITVS